MAVRVAPGAARRPSSGIRRIRRVHRRWTLDGEPYTVAPGQQWYWYRRAHARRSYEPLGRISLRWGPDDFRRRSVDGLGDDWPITYEDRSRSTTSSTGWSGSSEPTSQREEPAERAGRDLHAAAEAAVLRAAHPAGVRPPGHAVRPVAPVDPDPAPQRPPACHYCGQCGRGCSTHSNFSSPSVLLPPAIRPAASRSDGSDGAGSDDGSSGKATGVSFIDKATGSRASRARADRRACGELLRERRIMLNSKSAQHPHGLRIRAARSAGI